MNLRELMVELTGMRRGERCRLTKVEYGDYAVTADDGRTEMDEATRGVTWDRETGRFHLTERVSCDPVGMALRYEWLRWDLMHTEALLEDRERDLARLGQREAA